MDNKIIKIVNILMYVLFGLSIAFFAMFYLGGEQSITFSNEKEALYPVYTDLVMYWSYILFAISVVATLGFAIVYVIFNFSKAKNALIGIIALALISLVAYLMASGAIPHFHGVEKFNITESLSKLVGSGLYLTYLLLGLSILGVIYTEISKSFK